MSGMACGPSGTCAGRTLLLAALLASPASAQAAAQEPVPPDSAREFAAPFLPADHWALAAVRRLYGLGLAPAGYDPGRRALARGEVAAVLLRAAADTSAKAALARAYWARYAEEFPEIAEAVEGRQPGSIWLGRTDLLAGAELRRGSVRAGTGYENGSGWTGPVPAADIASGVLAGSASLIAFPHAAAILAPALRAGRLELADAHIAVARGGIGAWVGRRRVGFGPGLGGTVVLAAAVPLDGGGLFLTRPLFLPGPLGALLLETFVSRMERNGAVAGPWVWAARASLSPHARVSLGVNRAAVFGGQGNGEFSLRDLAYVIVGKHGGQHSEVDNQIVGLDAVVRPPVPGLPLVLHVEWGFEDSAGAWKDVPALVAGLELAAVPGLEELAVGIERASFAGSCCGNPIWYRHWAFEEGWTDRGVPLGHPLGGHGSEWLAHVRADLLAARLRLAGRLFQRDRGAENLFAPDRQGRSRGVDLLAELRIRAGWDGVARAFFESGERGWNEARLLAGLRARF